jgi:hypothetical protein
MPKKKSRRDIIKRKLGDSRGGGMAYLPPTARLTLVKSGKENDDDDDIVKENLLRLFVKEIIDDI